MSGKGLFAEHLRDMFDMGYKRAHFPVEKIRLSAASFRNAEDKQILFKDF